MTEMVIVCREEWQRSVYHTYDCHALDGAREDLMKTVPLDSVDDDLDRCSHCEEIEERNREPDVDATAGNVLGPRQSHYGGTLAIDMLYPDCTNCDADGAIYVTRFTPQAVSDIHSGEWQCLSCGVTFDVGPSSEWYGVHSLAEEISDAHMQINIRGASPSKVASAKGISTETLVARADRARDELRSRGVVLADD